MSKNNLDERQEQQLLKVEHNSCWLAFWGLLIAMAVQMILGSDFRQLAGEWLVFMALCLYLGVACFRNGIWDRRLQPTPKTNFKISLIAGLALGCVAGVTLVLNNPGAAAAVLFGAGLTAVVTFGLCFIALSLSAKAFKKRQNKLEAEQEEI